MIGVTAYAVKDRPICTSCLEPGDLAVYFRRRDDVRGKWIAICHGCARDLAEHLEAFAPRKS